MVACDSQRTPDDSRSLSAVTIEALLAALVQQRVAGLPATPELRRAIRLAGAEARERDLAPETLLVQLKALADEAGLAAPGWEQTAARSNVREWMVGAMLRAYWGMKDE